MHPILSTTRNVLLGTGAATLLASAAQAQINDRIRGPASEANHFIETPAGWEHPKTPWGEPDIRATLNMMQAAGVPLERCANARRVGGPPCDFDTKWRSEQEFLQQLAAANNRVDRSIQALQEGNLGVSIQSGLTDPSIPQRQLNLIMVPEDGQLPPLTAAAKQLAKTMGSDWALPAEDIVFEDETDFDSWDRCVTRGLPSSMMPYRYNGGFRIAQAPGYVVFELEMIHEARVIPTDGRPALPSDIKQYLGESRGRWEGNTLVVETTNFRDGMEINNPLINLAVVGSPPGNRFPQSDKMKITERVVRLNDDWWLYEITTEDPEVLTAPFTVRYPMHNDPNYWWPEYACHEDNTIVHNYVTTNRYERANPPPEDPQQPVAVSAELQNLLPGRWVGRPDIDTLDYDIEIEFTRNPDGTISGKLIGSDFGPINKPLRQFRITEPQISWQFPNIQAWSFSGIINEDGVIQGSTNSAQGAVWLDFKKVN